MAVSHLAATGRLDLLAAFSLFVTVLDQEHAGLPAALGGPKTAELAKRASRQRGYLDGRDLAEAYVATQRPEDAIAVLAAAVDDDPQAAQSLAKLYERMQRHLDLAKLLEALPREEKKAATGPERTAAPTSRFSKSALSPQLMDDTIARSSITRPLLCITERPW